MDRSIISSVTLKNGEKVALGAIEVVSIPHCTIINSGSLTEDDIVERYRKEMTVLLNEISQLFKSISMKKSATADIACEILWKTEVVENQSYNARVRIFIIVRSIERDGERASRNVDSCLKLIQNALLLQKYECLEISYAALRGVIGRIDDTSIKAIVKDEKIENLQNQYIPFCYTYGKFPSTKNDFSSLAGVLINHPNLAVSIQLIPTVFKNYEIAEIERTAQNLEILSRGVVSHGMGNISFSLADRSASDYRYYSEKKNTALYLYNFLFFGNPESAERAASKVFGQLTTGEGASSALTIIDLNRNEVRKDTNFFPLPWAVNEILRSKGRNHQIWRSQLVSKAMYRLPFIITGEEAAEVFRLPVGSERISAGFNVNESEKGNKTYRGNIINSGDITVGQLKMSSGNDTIGFSLKDLTKHMLVVGTPGSGKTTFSVGLLDRLWKEHGVPFLVIEPAKNEYRAMVQSIPDIQIFTPGKNYISPFVFNPFIPPKNVKLGSYKATLKTAFAAAVSMSTPLDKIFEDTINNCYSSFRWLDTYTLDDGGKVFNISDFIKCFQETFEKIGYTGDARNIGRAGIVRLNSLVNLFDNYPSIPIEDILKKPTIIELAAIENSDQKALIIALLLLSILAYVNANYVGEGNLKNVILLEEAHVLLDASANTGDAKPSEIAQGLIKRMLAEIRSYGVGMIIADQSPRKVTTDVVAMTDMKMVFRLVEGEDKRIIADSTNMSDVQEQRMTKLRPGEAFLFFGKLDEPEEVITPDYRLEKNIDITLADRDIQRLSTYWKDRADQLRPYPQCSLCSSCQVTCDYDRRILGREVARRIFARYFKADDSGFEPVKEVFSQITKLTLAELNGEKLSRELVSCVKVHLWRRIRYETKISVRDIQIENSLKK